MKATGIVRRIDDLGRVVIPKEIRRTMLIREGDPLEIFTDKDGELIFKKYSPIGELSDFAAQICDSLRKATLPDAVLGQISRLARGQGVPQVGQQDQLIPALGLRVADHRASLQGTDLPVHPPDVVAGQIGAQLAVGRALAQVRPGAGPLLELLRLRDQQPRQPQQTGLHPQRRQG